MQANIAALVAAFFFGLVLFPWKEAAARLGAGGVILSIGIVYVIFGCMHLTFFPLKESLRMSDIGFGALTAFVDLAAIVAYTYAVAHPLSRLPVVSALVAAAPLFTLAAVFLIFRQSVSIRECFFIVLTVIGIAGLSFFSHQP